MKILVLTSTFPRFAGDMQANFVGEQANAWRAARPYDQILILAPHDAGAARLEAIGGVRVERFRYLLPETWQRLAYPAILPNIRRVPALGLQVPFFLFGQYRAAKRIVRQAQPDLVYAHWVMPQGLIAWRLKQRFGIPYVLQNHSSDLSVFLKLGAAGRKLARLVLREAAHFFCVNTVQRDFALTLFEPGEREEFASRVTVLPMGVVPLAQGVSAAGAGYDIATIGRLSRKKGLDLLIEAAERLAARGVRPRIAIAGDGEDRTRLEALVSRADVTFAGFLAGGEKDCFLALAQRFAFPARDADGDVEGLPVALLEALMAGKPVLASRDTNIELLPEWPAIRDAVMFVVDPADIGSLEDAIERLLTADPAKAQTTAAIIARYNWDRLIEEYLAPIEAALAP